MSDTFGAGVYSDEPVKKGASYRDRGVERARRTYPPTVTAGSPGTAVIGGYIEEKERVQAERSYLERVLVQTVRGIARGLRNTG